MSILDDIRGVNVCGETFTRLRPLRKTDPYNPEQTIPVHGRFDELIFHGVLAQSSSTTISDINRQELRTSAVITVQDPNVDVRAGDIIRRAADGVKYKVTGSPARDVNAFTGWQPTAEIQVTEYKG